MASENETPALFRKKADSRSPKPTNNPENSGAANPPAPPPPRFSPLFRQPPCAACCGPIPARISLRAGSHRPQQHTIAPQVRSGPWFHAECWNVLVHPQTRPPTRLRRTGTELRDTRSLRRLLRGCFRVASGLLQGWMRLFPVCVGVRNNRTWARFRVQSVCVAPGNLRGRALQQMRVSPQAAWARAGTHREMVAGSREWGESQARPTTRRCRIRQAREAQKSWPEGARPGDLGSATLRRSQHGPAPSPAPFRAPAAS